MEESFGVESVGPSHRGVLESLLAPEVVDLLEGHRGLADLDPGKPLDYVLYTGRGPSGGSFHIGHLIGLRVVRALQRALGSKIFFMIADDEKMIRDGIEPDDMATYVHSTLGQLQALGFNSLNTDFHVNSKGLGEAMYGVLVRVMQCVNVNQLTHIFGPKRCLGEYFYAMVQLVPCFMGKQAVVVAGRDQDPFFRLARAIAKRLGHPPPILLYTKSVPGLDGVTPKMSTSHPASLPIFLTDTEEVVCRKLGKVRKVGAASLEALFEHGADLAADTLYTLVAMFERRPGVLATIGAAYTTGVPTDGEAHAAARAALGEDLAAKALMTRGPKTMITTAGMRAYAAAVVLQVLGSEV